MRLLRRIKNWKSCYKLITKIKNMALNEAFTAPVQKFKAPEDTKTPAEKADELVKETEDRIAKIPNTLSGKAIQIEIGKASDIYAEKIQELLKDNPDLLKDYQEKINDFVKNKVQAILDQNNNDSSSATHV